MSRPVSAPRFTAHLGYSPPSFRPQFLGTVGSHDPAAHIHFAARQGMAGVLYPWAIDRSPSERDKVRRALLDTGLACSCLAALPFESASRPTWTDRSVRGRADLSAAVVAASRLAVTLGSRVLAVFVGRDPDRDDLDGQYDDAAANLQAAADIASDHGLIIGVEPMLRMPRPLLQTTAEAVRLIEATGSQQVGLIYDTTHVSMMDGDLLAALDEHAGHIVALQLSDEPGRVEPGAGRLPLVEVVVTATRNGYAGLIDLEHGWLDPSEPGERAGLSRIRTFEEHVRRRLSLS